MLNTTALIWPAIFGDCDPFRTDADLARAAIARLLPVPAFETRQARPALEEVGEGAVEIDAHLLQRVPVEISKPTIPPTAFGNGERGLQVTLAFEFLAAREAVRPQRGRRVRHCRNNLTQQARPAVDELDQSVNAELGSNIDQQMHVVGHNLQFQDLGSALSRDIPDDLLQPNFDPADKHIAPILRASDDMVFTVECDVLVRSHAVILDLTIYSSSDLGGTSPRSLAERQSFPLPKAGECRRSRSSPRG
jgi:hypothetical protein